MMKKKNDYTSYTYPKFDLKKVFHLEKRLGPNKWETKGKGEFLNGPTIEVGKQVIVAGWVTTEIYSVSTHGMYVVFQTRNSIYRMSFA